MTAAPMVIIQRFLQISMATFAALGTTLLGMGERTILLPVLAVLVSASSVYVCDVRGWFRFNTKASNVAAVVALVLSIWQLEQFAGQSSLIAMANLLVYLQFILLYKPKTVANYWLLALTSLLQVAVAAALNLDMLFGFLLVVYMFVGLLAMALFFVDREHLAQAAWGTSIETLSLEPAAHRRWPLAGQQAVMLRAAPTSSSGDLGVGREFAGRIALLGCMSVVLAGAIFMTVPRTARVTHGPKSGYHLVGFAPEVTLGELGPILESPEQVMKVKFVDAKSGQFYALTEPPLLRGATLAEYAGGHWQFGPGAEHKIVPIPIETKLTSLSGLVRQEFVVEPIGNNVLFCVPPQLNISESSSLRYDPARDQIRRQPRDLSEQVDYQLLTSGLRNHRQVPVIPNPQPLSDRDRKQLLQLPGQDGEEGLPLPGLIAQAQEVVADVPVDSPQRRARILESYLRDSHRFQYSLERPARDRSVDPIEDFVTGHPTGHCEYFASALALMLRSVGVPARLAIGFKGGDFNPLTQCYEVQQLHAHSWVEAYLAPDQVPQDMMRDGPFVEAMRANGAWLVLDPTPGGPTGDSLAEGFGWYAFRQLRDYANAFWTEYVLGLDAGRQEEAIYRPMLAAIQTAMANAFDRVAWISAIQIVRQSVAAGAKRVVHGEASPPLLAALGLALLCVLFLARNVPRLLRWLRPRRRKTPPAASQIEFYRRFESLLARHEMTRPASQTQREFALCAGGQLSESSATLPAANLPRRIVDLFYRVRFGGRPLDNREAQEVEQALAELGGFLSGRGPKGRAPGRSSAGNGGSVGSS
jgi:transglutaminase-like putative cysteine protease